MNYFDEKEKRLVSKIEECVNQLEYSVKFIKEGDRVDSLLFGMKSLIEEILQARQKLESIDNIREVMKGN